MKFVLERLVFHLHAFAKEVNLETHEWVSRSCPLKLSFSDLKMEFLFGLLDGGDIIPYRNGSKVQ